MTVNLVVVVLIALASLVLAAKFRSSVYFSASLVVGFGFFAGTEGLGPSRLVLAILLAVHLFTLSVRGSAFRMAAATILALGLLITFILVDTSGADAGQRDWLFRMFVLFPLAFIVGYVSRGLGFRPIAVAWVLWSTVAASIAIAEYLSGTRFLRESTAVGADLVIRSTGGAEHPLVLACLLLASVPLARALTSKNLHFLGFSALVGLAIASTGSQGPMVLLLLYLLLVLVRRDRIIAQGRFIPITLSLILTATVLVGSIWRYTEPIITAVGGLASELYRVVISAVVWPSLMQAPFGWGAQGLPVGVYVAPSAYGPIDLSRTIDSEYVLLAIDFGVTGLMVAALAIWMPWMRASSADLRWAAGLALTCGLFLSVHSWAGFGALVVLLIAMSLGRTSVGRRSPGGPVSDSALPSPVGLGEARARLE